MVFLVTFISLDDLKNKKRALIFFSGIGAIQFIIMTIIAMFFYPRPYNFFFDHLSVLGFLDANFTPISFRFGLRLPRGPPLLNPISSVIFIITLIIAGIAMIPFWILMQSLFKEKRITKVISRVGSIIGLISSPFLMGVAFPADVFFAIHAISTMLFFLLFAAAIIVYTIVIFLKEDYPNRYAIFGVIIGAVAILYIFIPYTIFNAFHQKISVYLFVAWPLFQAIKLWKEV